MVKHQLTNYRIIYVSTVSWVVANFLSVCTGICCLISAFQEARIVHKNLAPFYCDHEIITVKKDRNIQKG